MKAIFYTSYGGPEQLRADNIPDPIPGLRQLLVQVKAVSLNPVDFKILKGDLKFLTGKKFPQIPGSDFAGIVKDRGADVKDFEPCDKVYGFVPTIFRKPGAMAEFVLAEPHQVRKLPEGMAFEEAASLPVACLTALNALRKGGDLKGKLLLVNGATGGVGHFALQIARASGARITAVCSKGNMELARKFGANEVIDYAQTDLANFNQQFDMILDAHGRMNPEIARKLLKKNGVFTTTGYGPSIVISKMYNRLIYGKTLTSANMRAEAEDFEEMEKLFREGKLNPYVEKTFPFEQAPDAFRMFEKGSHRGKMVIRI